MSELPLTPLSLAEIVPEVEQNREVLEYWLSLRGDAAIPRWTDFDPLKIAGPLANCIIIRLQEGRSIVSFMGSTLVDRFGMEMTGKDMADVFTGEDGDRILSRLRSVIDNTAVIRILSNMPTTDGNSIVIEIIGVPLCSDDGKIDHVLFSFFYVDRDFRWEDRFAGKFPTKRQTLEGYMAPL